MGGVKQIAPDQEGKSGGRVRRNAVKTRQLSLFPRFRGVCRNSAHKARMVLLPGLKAAKQSLHIVSMFGGDRFLVAMDLGNHGIGGFRGRINRFHR
jgi:hypothetical protein